MKTFGLFTVLLLLIVIGLSGVSKEWSGPEIIIQSTILAYIMQQYVTEELKNK